MARRCHGNRDGDMAAPAVLHSLHWLQMVLHSPPLLALA